MDLVKGQRPPQLTPVLALRGVASIAELIAAACVIYAVAERRSDFLIADDAGYWVRPAYRARNRRLWPLTKPLASGAA